MAIWNNAYGRNGLLSERQLATKDYLDILNRIPFNEIEIVDSLIEMEGDESSYSLETDQGILINERVKEAREKALERLNEFRNHFLKGEKSKWESISQTFFANKLCFFGEYHGVRMHITNDIISLYGPWGIFANNHNFQKELSVKARCYYHSYFTDILKVFKSDFILYAPEWYGINDGDSETKNVADLLALENWEKESSDSVHSMEYIYFEKL